MTLPQAFAAQPGPVEAGRGKAVKEGCSPVVGGVPEAMTMTRKPKSGEEAGVREVAGEIG